VASSSINLYKIVAVSLLISVIYTLLGNLFVFGNALHLIGDGLYRRTRLTGLFSNSTEYSDLISLSLIFFAFTCRRALRNYAVIVVLILLLVMTDARSSMGVLVFSVGIALLSVSRWKFYLIPGAILALGAIVVVGVPVQEFDDLGTLNGRTIIWQQAATVISENFFWGVGYGNSSDYLLMPQLDMPSGSAHNSFIEIFMTTGIFGFISISIFSLLLFRTAIASRSTLVICAISYIFLRSLFDHLVFAAEPPTLILLVLAFSFHNRLTSNYYKNIDRYAK
jgi:O-antigen ligase